MPKKTNVEINGNNYYRVTATIGKDNDDKPIRKQFYGSSKKEAEAKRDEYMSSINKGLSVNFEKAVFKYVFKSWFESVLKPKIALNTYSRYLTEYNKRIKDCILSNMKLADIKPINVQAYYNGLLENNSITTVHKTHRILTGFFNYCVRADLIIKSPLKAVELPAKKTKPNENYLPNTDVEKVVAAARENNLYFIYVFAIFTGLRLGEILALTHGDIDMEKSVIHVNKSVDAFQIDGEYQHVLSNTKTPSSIRDIPILDEIKPMLMTHIKNEKIKRLRMGIPFSQDCILFSSVSCQYQHPVNVRNRYKQLREITGIKETTFHGLRHTFCTLLAQMGVPLKDASVLMGHSNISQTAKTYTHVTNQGLKKSIEKLSAIFEH